MSATAYSRGWLIVYKNGKWLYADTMLDFVDNRPCEYCGKFPTKEGYDACLGYIPNVISACCGHNVHAPIMIKSKINRKDL